MSENCLVEFSKEESCSVMQEQISQLIEKAFANPFKKYRYCLHQKPECTLHEMIIVTTKYDLKYPDKHMYTTESNIILRGKLLMVLFNEVGDIQKSFVLDPEKTFYFRCEKNRYHMTLPLTDIAVFPDWAPNRENREDIITFNQMIKEKALKLV